jgi:hypothetical protein
MTLTQLKLLYEKRRGNLVNLLERNPTLEAARQHQIYGAICEIDSLLKTIEHLREQEMQETFELEAKGKGEIPRTV